MTTLHIQNLHYSVSENQLTAAFSEWGRVSRVLVLRGSERILAGAAFIDMEDEREARLAIAAYDGCRLAGLPLSIRVTAEKGPQA